MQDEAWRALFGRLLMTPPSRALSAAEAAPLLRHAVAARSAGAAARRGRPDAGG
jgi:hypothetical protein